MAVKPVSEEQAKKAIANAEAEDRVQKHVREMAKLAMLSGNLSDFHLDNLKKYGAIAFNGVKSGKIEYDLTQYKFAKAEEPRDDRERIVDAIEGRRCMSFVAYHVETDGSDQPNLERRIEWLESSARSLLWSDITVEIHLNGKIIHRSKGGK